MHEADLYHKAHKDLKEDVGKLITKYLSTHKWRNDGTDVLMDLGSGPGDVFMDYIYPQLPENCRKAICSDILPEMLTYARNYYKNPVKCEYRVLDAVTKEELPRDLKGNVDYVVSIFLLHWISDHKTALKNIHDLLRPNGGQCLIIFMPFNTVFDANDCIRASNKWKQYLHDIDNFVPTSCYSDTLAQDFHTLLKDAGFSDIATEETTGLLTYDNYEIYKDGAQSVCDLLQYVPESLQSEFLNDYVATMIDIVAKDAEAVLHNCIHCVRYKFLAAHAKRLSV